MNKNKEISEIAWIANQLGVSESEHILMLTTINFFDSLEEYIQLETKVGKVSCWDTITDLIGNHYKVEYLFMGDKGYVLADNLETGEREFLGVDWIKSITKYKI